MDFVWGFLSVILAVMLAITVIVIVKKRGLPAYGSASVTGWAATARSKPAIYVGIWAFLLLALWLFDEETRLWSLWRANEKFFWMSQAVIVVAALTWHMHWWTKTVSVALGLVLLLVAFQAYKPSLPPASEAPVPVTETPAARPMIREALVIRRHVATFIEPREGYRMRTEIKRPMMARADEGAWFRFDPSSGKKIKGNFDTLWLKLPDDSPEEEVVQWFEFRPE